MTRLAAAMMLMLIFISAGSLPASDGESLYSEYCQGCHGLDAASLSGYAGSRDDFQKILDGDSALEMPDFYGVFENEEVTALFAYIAAAPQ